MALAMGADWAILGKQAIDDDPGQTGQMLAALSSWPQGTFAPRVAVDCGPVTVIREVDGGLETVALTMPAIVTIDLRCNEPRSASLPNIMKAKSKPLAQKTTADCGVDLTPRFKTLNVVQPAEHSAGIKVADETAKIAGAGKVTSPTMPHTPTWRVVQNKYMA